MIDNYFIFARLRANKVTWNLGKTFQGEEIYNITVNLNSFSTIKAINDKTIIYYVINIDIIKYYIRK
jgi:hypothetical protein